MGSQSVTHSDALKWRYDATSTTPTLPLLFAASSRPSSIAQPLLRTRAAAHGDERAQRRVHGERNVVALALALSLALSLATNLGHNPHPSPHLRTSPHPSLLRISALTRPNGHGPTPALATLTPTLAQALALARASLPTCRVRNAPRSPLPTHLLLPSAPVTSPPSAPAAAATPSAAVLPLTHHRAQSANQQQQQQPCPPRRPRPSPLSPTTGAAAVHGSQRPYNSRTRSRMAVGWLCGGGCGCGCGCGRGSGLGQHLLAASARSICSHIPSNLCLVVQLQVSASGMYCMRHCVSMRLQVARLEPLDASLNWELVLTSDSVVS
jgi:hypothetical protein